MSFVAKIEKEFKLPKKTENRSMQKEIDQYKLASECRVCQLLKFNKGSCGGREGQNICLAFKESPTAKLREKAFYIR